MELAMGARAILRLLLTLLVLYSHAAAGQAPGVDMGDTLVDDEDVNIGERRTGIKFTVDMLSNVQDLSSQGCFDTNLLEALKQQIKTKLIAGLQVDCKCQVSEGIIDKEKIECETKSRIQYSGQISDWTSTTYSVKQLTEFINSWRAHIEVAGDAVNFAAGSGFNFTFNVTQSQSSFEELGSGDGMNIQVGNADDTGSGIVTIDVSIPGDDEDVINIGNVGEINDTSGQLRAQVIGTIVTLSTALAIVLGNLW